MKKKAVLLILLILAGMVFGYYGPLVRHEGESQFSPLGFSDPLPVPAGKRIPMPQDYPLLSAKTREQTDGERLEWIQDRAAEDLKFTVFFQQLFDKPGSLQGWEEHSFKKKTHFSQIKDPVTGAGVLRAYSNAASSGIFHKVKVPVEKRPHISWEWRAVKFPYKKNHSTLGTKAENDYAMRVYAVFQGPTILLSKAIQYVWDEHFPEGTHASSPSSGRVKVLVVHSGQPDPGRPWVKERRDVMRDYQMLFGEKPKKGLAAVAIMTDSDNTASEAEAYIKSIAVEIPR